MPDPILIAGGIAAALAWATSRDSKAPPPSDSGPDSGIGEQIGGAVGDLVGQALAKIGDEERSIIAVWRETDPSSAPSGRHPAGPRQWTAWLRLQQLCDDIARHAQTWAKTEGHTVESDGRQDSSERVTRGIPGAAAAYLAYRALADGRWPWRVPSVLIDIAAPPTIPGAHAVAYSPVLLTGADYLRGREEWRDTLQPKNSTAKKRQMLPNFDRSCLKSARHEYPNPLIQPDVAPVWVRSAGRSREKFDTQITGANVIPSTLADVNALCAGWKAGSDTKWKRMPPRSVWQALKRTGLYPVADWQLTELALFYKEIWTPDRLAAIKDDAARALEEQNAREEADRLRREAEAEAARVARELEEVLTTAPTQSDSTSATAASFGPTTMGDAEEERGEEPLSILFLRVGL